MALSIRSVFLFAFTLLSFSVSFSLPSKANEEVLPIEVDAVLSAPLEEIGQGTYRKLGFTVYHASLWAAHKPWESNKPYALRLHYTRSLSKETLVDTAMNDIEDQEVADEQTRERWKNMLNTMLPDVKANDVLVGFAVPGQKTLLFFNGVKIATIDDEALSGAFFNIWLGEHADESLRAALLGTE